MATAENAGRDHLAVRKRQRPSVLAFAVTASLGVVFYFSYTELAHQRERKAEEAAQAERQAAAEELQEQEKHEAAEAEAQQPQLETPTPEEAPGSLSVRINFATSMQRNLDASELKGLASVEIHNWDGQIGSDGVPVHPKGGMDDPGNAETLTYLLPIAGVSSRVANILTNEAERPSPLRGAIRLGFRGAFFVDRTNWCFVSLDPESGIGPLACGRF